MNSKCRIQTASEKIKYQDLININAITLLKVYLQKECFNFKLKIILFQHQSVIDRLHCNQIQHIKNTQKMQTQTKITLVRHAESLLNIASHEFRVKNNLPYIWEELCKYKEFILGVKYNPAFLDCDITEHGISQCITAQSHVQDIKPDIILVSPLFRTLRTCSLVFENHKDVPVVVEPLLAEAFRTSCDIASETGPKVEKFPTYNFDAVLESGDFWFIKNESEENQQKYFQVLRKNQDKSYTEKCYDILNLMIETYIFQHPEQVRKRTYQIKEMVRDKYAGKYKHIAIVAHYNIINYLMAQQFDANSEPIDCLQVANCEVVQNFLEELLKYK